MARRLEVASIAVALLAAGCGGGDSSGPGGGGQDGNTFTARIDGQAWSASGGTISVSGSPTPTRQGTLVVSGAETASGIVLLLSVSFIVGPATQPLGVNTGSNPGGSGSVSSGAKLWMTPFDGASGFVTFTARTSNRIAGTFHFTARANPGTSPATTTVTEGAFDITVPAGLPPLPTGVGSTAIATFGGTPWNAATIVGSRPAPDLFVLAADNTSYSMTLLPKVPVAAGNTYGIPSQIGLTVIRTGTADSWWGGTGADVGTVTIGTLQADRLVATFSATLPPLAGAAPLAVSGGAVNAYLQQ